MALGPDEEIASRLEGKHKAHARVGVLGVLGFIECDLPWSDSDRIGKQDGAPYCAALAALAERTGRQVCLVVARGVPGRTLMLVFTSSCRSRLAALLHGREQAFYGASITDFPPLGEDYARAYASWINEKLIPQKRFVFDEIVDAFSLLWNKPEYLPEAIKAAAAKGSSLHDQVAVIIRRELASAGPRSTSCTCETADSCRSGVGSSLEQRSLGRGECSARQGTSPEARLRGRR